MKSIIIRQGIYWLCDDARWYTGVDCKFDDYAIDKDGRPNEIVNVKYPLMLYLEGILTFDCVNQNIIKSTRTIWAKIGRFEPLKEISLREAEKMSTLVIDQIDWSQINFNQNKRLCVFEYIRNGQSPTVEEICEKLNSKTFPCLLEVTIGNNCEFDDVLHVIKNYTNISGCRIKYKLTLVDGNQFELARHKGHVQVEYIVESNDYEEYKETLEILNLDELQILTLRSTENHPLEFLQETKPSWFKEKMPKLIRINLTVKSSEFNDNEETFREVMKTITDRYLPQEIEIQVIVNDSSDKVEDWSDCIWLKDHEFICAGKPGIFGKIKSKTKKIFTDKSKCSYAHCQTCEFEWD